MKNVMLVGCAVLIAFTSVLACSSNVAEKRAAKPGMMERLKRDSVTGEVVDIQKTSVSIREDSGVTTRVRVDEMTKMDTIQTGDRAKAYVNDAGYATTLKRLSK
jgi:ribosomal protein S1